MIKIESKHIYQFIQENKDNKDYYQNDGIFNKVCKILSDGVIEPQLLDIIKNICETITIQNNKIQMMLSSKAKDLKIWETNFLETGSQIQGKDQWPNEVVYSVYHNEVLEDLPLPIVEQMRDHIQSIINKKIERTLLDEKVNSERYLSK